ncbi:hypothetical protein [Butyricimonas virosa]|uniref:hypothetical protein n=1 Tax=Butyricimonas virosa TaxID=544645 RepID=UPI00242FDC9F|nr:hypothetical protein [Butyricimonas virosa]
MKELGTERKPIIQFACMLLIICMFYSCGGKSEKRLEKELVEMIQDSEHLTKLANKEWEGPKFKDTKDVIQFLAGEHGTAIWKCNKESDDLYYVTAKLVIPDGNGEFEFRFPCVIKKSEVKSWFELYMNGTKSDNTCLYLLVQMTALKRSILETR